MFENIKNCKMTTCIEVHEATLNFECSFNIFFRKTAQRTSLLILSNHIFTIRLQLQHTNIWTNKEEEIYVLLWCKVLNRFFLSQMIDIKVTTSLWILSVFSFSKIRILSSFYEPLKCLAAIYLSVYLCMTIRRILLWKLSHQDGPVL